MLQPPNILTIAGSDSGGGAGIQADLKTIMALGGYGMSVITALTAQNGEGVTGIHAPSPDFIVQQWRTVRDGFPIAAAKTGMLFSTEIIKALVPELRTRDFPLVIDPVCVSQSGHTLLQAEAIAAIQQDLIPLADVLTPNRPEAEALTGHSITSPADIATAGATLLSMGAKAVLIKGGHFDADIMITDWLCLPNEAPIALHQAHVDTKNNHGTGCTLSAAIATYLGLGMPLRVAITKAQEYVNLGLRKSYTPGKGVGPLNHAAVR